MNQSVNISGILFSRYFTSCLPKLILQTTLNLLNCKTKLLQIKSWLTEILFGLRLLIKELPFSQNLQCIEWISELSWIIQSSPLTLASPLTGGFDGNSTSVAFNIVFSSKMAAWDKLCPNGCKKTTTNYHFATWQY